MSTNEQQIEDTITAALDAIARNLAQEVVRLDRRGAIDETPVDKLAAVGSFLLAYRRDRDERASRKGAA